VVAHAMAVELRRRGCEVQQLVLLDPTVSANRFISLNPAWRQIHVLKHILRVNHIDVPRKWGSLTYEEAEELLRRRGSVEFAFPPKELIEFMAQSLNANWLRLLEHKPDVFDGDVVIFSAGRPRNIPVPTLRLRRPGALTRLAFRYQQRSWRPYVSGDVAEHPVGCSHYEMLATESLRQYGHYFKTNSYD
ncbi:long-chain fatty acid--CoA ligase, partial [Mycolicibacterium septicum]|nr:long-chain fatty acid--CoA ligase [Mycolicibacterium septicum]